MQTLQGNPPYCRLRWQHAWVGPDDEGSRFCQATRRYTLRDPDIQSLLVGPQNMLSKPLGEATTIRCPHITSPAIGYSHETRSIHPGHSNIDKAPADPAARGTATHSQNTKICCGFYRAAFHSDSIQYFGSLLWNVGLTSPIIVGDPPIIESRRPSDRVSAPLSNNIGRFFFRFVGTLLPDHMASRPRRQEIFIVAAMWTPNLTVRFSTAKFHFDIYRIYAEIYLLFVLRLLSSALSVCGCCNSKNPKRHGTVKNPNMTVQLEPTAPDQKKKKSHVAKNLNTCVSFVHNLFARLHDRHSLSPLLSVPPLSPFLSLWTNSARCCNASPHTQLPSWNIFRYWFNEQD